MLPEIKIINEKKLVGKKLLMTFVDNRTKELWQNFMPICREIQNTIGSNLYSVQIYNYDYFNEFNPNAEFEKWSCIEVFEFDKITDGLEMLIVPNGLYAVFNYKGLSTDTKIFQYIYTEWLPTSIYELDNRPHFEILGEKYKNNNPDSEEQICIPIKIKTTKN